MRATSDREGSEEQTVRYWQISLGAGLAVLAIVAFLLGTLTQTAQRIQSRSAAIWLAGKLIASNTVHIPLLDRSNQILDHLSGVAEGIARSTERIERSVRTGSGKEG